MMSRRRFVRGSAIGLACASVFGGVHVASAMSKGLHVARAQLPWPGASGLRLIHITDLHIGLGTSEKLVDQVVEATAAARPDLVVLTGDYLNMSLTHLGKLERFAHALPGAKVATLGNHDHWSGADTICQALRTNGVEVLRNESLVLSFGSGALTIVGVDDGLTDHADVDAAFRSVQDPQEALVLTHYPLTAEQIEPHGGRLVLAGHTHGILTKAPRTRRFAERFRPTRYLHGFYEVGRSTLYVGGGIGSTWPARPGGQAPPEITIFDLV